MSTTTQCPTCNTRFKVSQEQLEAHNGLVRCGRCQGVFNAREQLLDDQPSPQLDLPIAVAASLKAAPVLIAPVTHTDPAPVDVVTPVAKSPAPKATVTKPPTLAQQVKFTDSMDEDRSEPDRPKRNWPLLFGNAVLLITLLGQGAYFYRVELATNMPGLKPALVAYCALLQCVVPLPQKADLMSIDSSDLEADPAQVSVIALNALLRNRAPYAQAYPNLELTLTDPEDKPLARRTFHPAEYLKPGEDEKPGLAAGRELTVKLNLDTADLKPSGYRLLLFYPQ